MNIVPRVLWLCAIALVAPLAYAADAPADSSVTGGLSDRQLSAGLKTGLGAALHAAMGKLAGTDGLSLSAPPALAQIASKLGSADKSGTGDALGTSLQAAAEKIAPQAAGLMRELFKSVSIDDAKAVLAGGSDAGTQLVRKAVAAPLRAKLLPLVTEATASAGVGAKAKEMLASLSPFASLAGKSSAGDIDGYVCDQVIDQCFQLMGKEEAAIRANPSILKNQLAQKVFSLAQK